MSLCRAASVSSQLVECRDSLVTGDAPIWKLWNAEQLQHRQHAGLTPTAFDEENGAETKKENVKGGEMGEK